MRMISVCLQLNSMSNYFDREVKRRGFVVQRWDFREKEKMEIENEKKNRAGVNITVHFFTTCFLHDLDTLVCCMAC